MKKLIAIAAIVIASVTTAQVKAQPADTAKGFDVGLFQKALVDEMYIQFPGLNLDTTLDYVLRAENVYEKNSDGTNKLVDLPNGKKTYVVLKEAQEVAGNPSCFTARDKGKATITANEKEEAKRIVTEYKERLVKRLAIDVTPEGLDKLGYVEFDALAINKNGIILYALVIDRNFDRNSVIVDVEKLDKELESMGFTVIVE
jgi:hypothetical protein